MLFWLCTVIKYPKYLNHFPSSIRYMIILILINNNNNNNNNNDNNNKCFHCKIHQIQQYDGVKITDSNFHQSFFHLDCAIFNVILLITMKYCISPLLSHM